MVAAAIGRGIEAAGAGPVLELPIADGGEGTVDALLRARGGELRTAAVEDALGRAVEARFALLDGGRVGMVELAEASGLWRLEPAELDPERASTAGTGQLIRAAIEAGVEELVVAVGGSATTDGGRGALEALGARFDREPVLEPLRRLLEGVRLVIACDVENPLLGPRGTAAVFAAQKGADAAAVKRLELRLREWSSMALKATGRDPGSLARAGAAGGFAAGLWAFAGAELVAGADFVLDELEFDRQARAARAVVTGEGRLDAQTLEGKAVARVAARCAAVGVPAFAVVGRLDPGVEIAVDVVEAAAPGAVAGVAEIEAAARSLAARLP